jgi:uncharacterized protein with PQ loop repeat
MHINILDQNVSLPMNVFIIIGNVITLVQNVPQVIKTYQVKSTRDFSAIFLSLRVIACLIWGAYSIEISSLLMLINNLITLLSTIFLGYYKVKEIIYDYKNKRVNVYMEVNDNNINNNLNLENQNNNDNYNNDEHHDDEHHDDEQIVSL